MVIIWCWWLQPAMSSRVSTGSRSVVSTSGSRSVAVSSGPPSSIPAISGPRCSWLIRCSFAWLRWLARLMATFLCLSFEARCRIVLVAVWSWAYDLCRYHFIVFTPAISCMARILMSQPRGCCGTNQVLLTIISRCRKMVYGVCLKESVRGLLGQSDGLSPPGPAATVKWPRAVVGYIRSGRGTWWQSDGLSLPWPSGYCRGNASCRKECLLGGLSGRGANSDSKPIWLCLPARGLQRRRERDRSSRQRKGRSLLGWNARPL